MRKTFIVLTIIFSVAGLVFTILPMGTIALAAVLPAIIFAILSLVFSKEKPKKLPKILVIITVTLFLAVAAKEVFIKDKVAQDTNFIQKQEESLQQAQQELEQIEGLE